MKDPETMSRVKRIWSMGTAGLGQGNATPVAEFNVYKDAEAYKVMLDSGIDLTIIGLDICEEVGVLFDSLQLSAMDEYGAALQFVSRAADKLLEFRRQTQGVDNVSLCDAVAMGCLIWSDYVVDGVDCSASCITHDCEAQIEDDYMLTFANYYGIEPGTDKYDMILDNNLKEMLRTVADLEDGASLEGIDLKAAVETFLLEHGMEAEKLERLEAKLISD